nr:MAG TPA: hypothetical protein [Caudoviricetes sp.]
MSHGMDACRCGIRSDPPDTRIEIIIFSVTEKEWVRFLVFPTLFLCH